MALAFQPGHGGAHVMEPFAQDGSCTTDKLAPCGADPLRAEARLALAESVASLQKKGTNAAVRASAEAFAISVRRMIKSASKDLSVDVAAPWKLFARELKPKRESESSGSPFALLFGDDSGPGDEVMPLCSFDACAQCPMCRNFRQAK